MDTNSFLCAGYYTLLIMSFEIMCRRINNGHIETVKKTLLFNIGPCS